MGSRSSTEGPEPSRPGEVVVGVVRRAHGIRGEVVVDVLSDVPGRFDSGSELIALEPSGRRRGLTLTAARPHKGALLLRFDQIADRNAAEALRGAELVVEASRTPPPEPGSYYHYQLLGCRCHDRKAGDLGEVVELLEDGGGLLLLVEKRRRRLPIPFVEAFLERVDIEAKRIELTLPEGLVEACASGS